MRTTAEYYRLFSTALGLLCDQLRRRYLQVDHVQRTGLAHWTRLGEVRGFPLHGVSIGGDDEAISFYLWIFCCSLRHLVVTSSPHRLGIPVFPAEKRMTEQRAMMSDCRASVGVWPSSTGSRSTGLGCKIWVGMCQGWWLRWLRCLCSYCCFLSLLLIAMCERKVI